MNENVEDYYDKLKKNENIYLNEVKNIGRIRNIFNTLMFFSLYFGFSLYVVVLIFYNYFEDIFKLKIEKSLFTDIIFYGFLISVIITLVIVIIADRKINSIKKEVGLTNNELLFLRTYELYKDIVDCTLETNLKRKNYLKKMSLEKITEIIDNINDWSYGNIILVKNWIGKDIDLLKNNLKRLLYPNIIKGNEKNLNEIANNLNLLSKFILNEDKDLLLELNESLNKLPYIEIETRSIKNSIYERPRLFRFLFSIIIVMIIYTIGTFFKIEMSLMFASLIASFWGAFTGFDKIFHIEQK